MGLRDAERRRRLVEQDDLRVPHYRARNRDGLALAARERGNRRPHAANGRHVEPAQHLERTSLHLELGQAPQHGRRRDCLAAKKHVRHHIKIVAESKVLIDGLDAKMRGLSRRVDLDLRAVESDHARIRLVRPRDDLDESRFAGAVVAGERDNLGRIDLEIHAGQRVNRSEALRDALEFKDWRGAVYADAPVPHRRFHSRRSVRTCKARLLACPCRAPPW